MLGHSSRWNERQVGAISSSCARDAGENDQPLRFLSTPTVKASAVSTCVETALEACGTVANSGRDYFPITTKALNRVPVDIGALGADPVSAALVRPLNGSVTAPPVYVPVTTGVPKKFWAFLTS